MSDGGLPVLPCVTPNLTNSLKLTISFSGNRVQKHSDTTATEITDSASPATVTSDNLLQVLLEVHRLLVRRDPKEIFANPVTDDVAFGYSQVIANPMDLGTIYTRLCSRTCYQSASDYLADVTLMCDNAMVYNSPDTIYYQRARKLLVFCRKQLSAPALRKIAQQLGLIAGLTETELGESSLSGELPFQRGQFNSICVRRLSGQESSQRVLSRQTASVRSSFKDWYLVPTSDRLSSTPKITMARSSLGSDSTRPGNHCDHHSPSPVTSPANSKTSLPSPSQSDSFHTDMNYQRSSPSADDICARTCDYPLNSPTDQSRIPLSPRRPRGRPRKSHRGSLRSSSVIERVISSPTSGSNVLVQLSPLNHCSNTCFSVDEPPATFTEGPSDVFTGSAFDGTPVIYETTPVSTPHFPSGTSSVSDTSHGVLAAVTKPSPSLSSPKKLPNAHNPPVTPPATRNRSISHRSRDRSQLVSSLRKLKKRSVDITSSLKHSAEIGVRSKRSRARSPVKSAPRILASCPRRKPKCLHKVGLQSTSLSDACRSLSSSAVDCTRIPEPSLLSVEEVVMPAESEDKVLVQARRAAAMAADRLRAKYASTEQKSTTTFLGPRIVYLDCSTPGEVMAIDCWRAQSFSEYCNGPAPPLPVNYPPILVHCLTGSRPYVVDNPRADAIIPSDDTKGKSTSRTLVDPPTPQEIEIMKQLEKLKYNPDEPISAAIHGPLAIFSQAEMARFSDVYGVDLATVEYAHSLLKFVEPMGRWARRWATKRLDVATDGMHSQLARFEQNASSPKQPTDTSAETDPACPPKTTWMQSLGLTLDSPTPPSSPEPSAFASIPDEESSTPLLKCLLSVDDNTEVLPSVDSSGPVFHLASPEAADAPSRLSVQIPGKHEPDKLPSAFSPGPNSSLATSAQYTNNNAGPMYLIQNDSDDDCVLISPIQATLTSGDNAGQSANTPTYASVDVAQTTLQSTSEPYSCTAGSLNMTADNYRSSMLKCALSTSVYSLPTPIDNTPSAVPPKSIIIDSTSKTRHMNGSLLQHSSHLSAVHSESIYSFVDRASCETGTLLSHVLSSPMPLSTAAHLTYDGKPGPLSAADHISESPECCILKLESDSCPDSSGLSRPLIVSGVLENKHYSTKTVNDCSDGSQEAPVAGEYAFGIEYPSVHIGITNVELETHLPQSKSRDCPTDECLPTSCQPILELVPSKVTLSFPRDSLGDHSTAVDDESSQVDPFSHHLITDNSVDISTVAVEHDTEYYARIDDESKTCIHHLCLTHPADHTLRNTADGNVSIERSIAEYLSDAVTSRTVYPSSSCSSASACNRRGLGPPVTVSELSRRSASPEAPCQIMSPVPKGGSTSFEPQNDYDMSGTPSIDHDARETVDSGCPTVSIVPPYPRLTISGGAQQFETTLPMNETSSSGFSKEATSPVDASANSPVFVKFCQSPRRYLDCTHSADSLLPNHEVLFKTSDVSGPLLSQLTAVTAVDHCDGHSFEKPSSNVTSISDHSDTERLPAAKISSSVVDFSRSASCYVSTGVASVDSDDCVTYAPDSADIMCSDENPGNSSDPLPISDSVSSASFPEDSSGLRRASDSIPPSDCVSNIDAPT